MMYFILKTGHVILASLLIGLMVGAVAPVIYGVRCYPADWQKRTLKRSLFLSLFGVIPIAMAQMMLGCSIMAIQHYAMESIWIRLSLAGFACFLLSWCVSIYCLSSWRLARGRALRNNSSAPLTYYYHCWLKWVIIATVFLSLMVFMMTNQSVLP